MNRSQKRFFLALLLLTFGIVTFAQNDVTPISIGETITVEVAPASAENPIELGTHVTFELTEPTYVTLIARAPEDDPITDPVLTLFESNRQIITVPANPYASIARQPTDAIIEDSLLMPGFYRMIIARADQEGAGTVEVGLQAGTEDFLGMGDITVIRGVIEENQRYVLTVPFQAGEIVSIAAISPDSEAIDLRLAVRDSANNTVANNDDHETLDINLGDFDPKIDRWNVLADNEYRIIVRGFNPTDAGPFNLIITRYGLLDSSTAGTDDWTFETRDRERHSFPVEGSSGELVNITARAANGSFVDPEFTLLSPDSIIVIENDDHSTSFPAIDTFDARIERFMLEQDGTYTLEINSVSGFGTIEVILERLGIFSTADFPEIDATRFEVQALDTPEDVEIPPEITAEPQG